MPSDARIAQALAALTDAKETFVSSVAMSAEEVRGILERDQGLTRPPGEIGPRAGPLCRGENRPDRLAPFVGANQKMDEDKRLRVQEAYELLLRLKKAGDEMFTAKVPLDGYLRGTVISALGKIGRHLELPARWSWP